MFEENLKIAELIHILLRMPDYYHYELFQKKDLARTRSACGRGHLFFANFLILKEIKYLKKQVGLKVLKNQCLLTNQTARIHKQIIKSNLH